MNGFQYRNMIQFLVWNWHPTFWVSAKYSEIRQEMLLMAQILYPVEQKSLIPFLKQACFFEASLMVQWGGFFLEKMRRSIAFHAAKSRQTNYESMAFGDGLLHLNPGAKQESCTQQSLELELSVIASHGAIVAFGSFWLMTSPRVSTAEFFQF